MAVNLELILSRWGTTTLSKLIGPDSVSILENLDYRNITASKLAKIILQQFGPEFVLLNKQRRNKVFRNLKQTNLTELSSRFKLKTNKNLLNKMYSLSFPRKHDRTKQLFNFFGFEPPAEEVLKNIPAKNTVECQYPLFDHQITAIEEIKNYLNSEHKKVFLHMPTGAGKTRTSMNVVAQLLRNHKAKKNLIIWLAYSEELCDQAADEFEKAWNFLGNRSVNIYRYYKSYDVDLKTVENGILIASLGKLYQSCIRKPSCFLPMAQKAFLIIMDEAHQSLAPTYRHLLEMASLSEYTMIMGLSATPGRSLLEPGEDIKLASFFARQKVTLNVSGYDSPIEYLYKMGYLAKPIFEQINYKATDKLTPREYRQIRISLDIPVEILNKLSKDSKRNLLIISRIIQETKEGNKKNKILVFACSVQHAIMLSNVLNIMGHNSAAITSNTLGSRRSKLIDDFKKTKDLNILVNYGVLTTGFDVPMANVAFITRPTQSVILYSQMIGRVSRGVKVGGNKICKIITVKDEIIKIKNMSDAFRFWDDIWE